MPDLRLTARAIASIQTADGCIPWAPGRHADPWDHIESAMALDVAGLRREAEQAYAWLEMTQRADGSWFAATVGDEVLDPTLDANFTAYVATGVWHHFLCTGDTQGLRRQVAMLERAISFVLDLQLPGGAIAWARDPDYLPADGALLTSSSSIAQSLRCGIEVMRALGEERPDWELSLGRVDEAIRSEDPAFIPKDRYAMDWYYPVLGGALKGHSALERLAGRWDEFVIPQRGVLCTTDRPWVTTGETCELVMALAALGDEGRAQQIYGWVHHLRDDDGLYWTGKNHPDGSLWPREKTTWSAASVILAHDCLDPASPTSAVFRHRTQRRVIESASPVL